MADAVDDNTPSAPPAEAPAEQTKTDEPLGENGLSALRKERERADAAEKLVAEFKAREDAAESAKLSDIDRANKATAEAQAALVQAQTDLARAQALAKYPVPSDYQDLVVGTDAASFEASAQKLHELHSRAEGKAPRPDPVPSSGTGPTQPQVAGGLAAGRAAYAAKKAK